MLEFIAGAISTLIMSGLCFKYFCKKVPKFVHINDKLVLETSLFPIPSAVGYYDIEIGFIQHVNYDKFSRECVEENKPIFSKKYRVHSSKDKYYHSFPIVRPSQLGEKGLTIYLSKHEDNKSIMIHVPANDVLDISEAIKMYESFSQEHHNTLECYESD